MEHHWVCLLFFPNRMHVVLTRTPRTVLSSSGNDGKVRLWKQTVGGVWRTAGHISVEQEEEKADGADVDMEE